MMRQALVSSLVAGSLVVTSAGMAMAQDEDLRMGDDPAYFERIEVPEVGIAVAFPPQWDVEIEMYYDENEPGDPETGYWTVLYADGGGSTWCDITMNVSRMGDLPGLAALTAKNFAESRGEDASAQANPVRLAVGNGYRVDVQDPDEGTFTTIYIFDSETARYSMVCMTDVRDERDWIDIAETIEWLAEEPVVEPEPSGDGQRIEIPDTDIAMTFPLDWVVEATMEEDQLQLPAAYGDDATVTSWGLLLAFSPDASLCYVEVFDDMPMGLLEHGNLLAERLGQSDTATVESGPATLPVGESVRVALDDPGREYFMEAYLFDAGGARYEFSCLDTVERDSDVWRDLAEAIESLALDPIPEPELEPVIEPDASSSELERVELPEAGITLAIPEGWTYETTTEVRDYQLPSEFGDGSTVPTTSVLSMQHEGAGSFGVCGIATFEEMPMSLERHAYELGSRLSGSDPSTPPVTTPIELPIGDAARVDFEFVATGYPSAGWVFDIGGLRVVVDCWAHRDEKPVWQAMVESIEPLRAPAVAEEPQVFFNVPTYELERVEVPEAGVSLLLPPDWSLEVPMDEYGYRLPPEYTDADPPTVWGALEAGSDMGDFCRLMVHSNNPMTLDQHALWDEESHAAAASDVQTVERLPTVVGDGLGHQIDKRQMNGPEVVRIYLFESGGIRFELTCGSPFDDNLAWYDIADSVEPLPGAHVLFGVEPDAEPEPEPDAALQRVELADAGVAMMLPADWEVVPEMESVGLAFLPEDAADADVEVWRVMTAYSVNDEWCSVYVYDGIHISLDDHATWFEQLSGIDLLGTPPVATETESVGLPIGDAARYTQTAEDGDVSTSYLFDMAGNREYIACGAPYAPDDAWRSIAESIEPLAGPGALEAQRVEVPGVGIAVTFPADWQTEMLMDEYEMAVPPGTERAAWVLTLLGAWSPDGVNCGLEMFEDNPLSLEAHVAWVEQVNREDPGFEGSIGHVPVQLPVGEAIRVDGDHQADGVWTTIYLFDSGDTRYLMYCADAVRAADDYLSIAETIELLEPVPPGVPEDALSWTQVEDFGSTLPVSETTAMRAWCELALWIEHADGTFEEHLECTLTDDPVDPADTQGFLPDANVTLSGGACEWLSDFWLNYDGSEVVATSWAAEIEPDGSFTGLANYAPELLECDGD